MKSRWLPTMPLHVANWMADPSVRDLSPAGRGDLIDALCRSWMAGRAVAVPGAIAEAYAEIWPQVALVREEHEEKHRVRSELGRQGNLKRWGSPSDSPGDRKDSDRSPSPSPSPSPSEALSPTAPSEPDAAKTPRRRPTKHRPDDEALTEARKAFALAEGLTEIETAREWAKMGDHQYRDAHSDWTKAWQNWVRREIDKRSPRKGKPMTKEESDAVDALFA